MVRVLVLLCIIDVGTTGTYACFPLHCRHAILFAFFSFENCGGKLYYEQVELYLWGAAIGLGRSGHTTICRPL